MGLKLERNGKLSQSTPPFTEEDIDGVSIIIHVKGDSYAIVPHEDVTKEEARELRIEIGKVALLQHDVVVPPINKVSREELNDALRKRLSEVDKAKNLKDEKETD